MTDPLVSVLLPCRPDEADALAHTLPFLRRQSYSAWQLLVAGSEPVIAVARSLAVSLPLPLRAVGVGEDATRAEALARAVSASDGSWLVVLDPGDELGEDALSRIVDVVHQDPSVDVIYSDEDEQDNDGTGPFHKPEWSPEYLEGLDYFGRLTAYRRAVVDAAGGVRPALEGAHEWDLALRVTELTDRIVHVPRPLCRRRRTLRLDWRDEPVRSAGRRAVLDRYARRGASGRVDILAVPGCLLARPDLLNRPSVTVVIPTAGVRRLVGGRDVVIVRNCLDALAERTDYRDFDVVLVVGEAEPPGLRRHAQERLGSDRVSVVAVPGPFEFSRACNTAAVLATGEYLLLLNDDIEPVEPHWLDMLLERGQDPQVGAVAPKLLFEDGTVQHSGVFRNPAGVPNHIHFHEVDGGGYHGSLQVTLNHTAVTGACLLIRRSTYLDVGGLTPRLPMSFGDVDLCLKLRARGLRNVVVNAARLLHFESSSRDPTVTESEYAVLARRWPGDSALERYMSHRRLPLDLQTPKPAAAGDPAGALSRSTVGAEPGFDS